MTKPLLDVEGIKRIIPHRAPMLLLDAILEMDTEARTILGARKVTEEDFFFQGHFPGHPVMPGVLTLEAMAQTAAVLVNAIKGATAENSLFYFAGLESVRFRQPVRPGATLQLQVKEIRSKAGLYVFEGQALVDGAVAAEARFSAKYLTR